MLLDQLSPLTGQEPFLFIYGLESVKSTYFATLKTISYFLGSSSKVAQMHAFGQTITTNGSRAIFINLRLRKREKYKILLH